MPVTVEQYEKSQAAPPLCEQLRIRDLVDDVAIQLDGSLVAGYELGGEHSYYASDEMRNRSKNGLEALLRALPERSMRMQVRFEIAEGAGDLITRYNQEQRNPSPVLQAIDRMHADLWRKRDGEGLYLRHLLHAYFIWNPRIHRQSPDIEWKKKMRGGGSSLSATKCVERTRREHEELLAEFNSLMSGVEATLQATGMTMRRMTHDDIFLEVKRALHPLGNDVVRYRPPEKSLVYESARSQMANVNLEDETDDYLPAFMLLLVAIALWKWSARSRSVALAIPWLVFPVLPVLYVQVFGNGNFAHNRYLYLSSVGFAMLIAAALRKLNFGKLLFGSVTSAQNEGLSWP